MKIILIVVGVIVCLGLLSAMAFTFGVWRLSRSVHVGRNGDVVVATPNGTVSTGDSSAVSEADLGVPIYPGASRREGGMQINSTTGSMVTVLFSTPDPVSKVVDFYRAKLGNNTSVIESGTGAVISAGERNKQGVVITSAPTAESTAEPRSPLCARSRNEGRLPAGRPPLVKLLRFAGALHGKGLETSQNLAPTLADTCSYRRGAHVMTLEVAMLELDQRGRVSHGDELHLDLAGLAEVGRELPIGLQSPGKNELVRRVPFEDAAPLTGAAILTDLEPSAARAGLDDDLDEGRGADVMGGGPPGRHVRREELECLEWRQFHFN